MLSKLKRILPNCVHPRLKYMPISLKLAFIYSIMLSMILVITLSATLIGIHYVLYREAEISVSEWPIIVKQMFFPMKYN